MSLDENSSVKPHERLAGGLKDDLEAVGALIRARMASKNAPRIPEVTAHLVDAGGKRVRPMLTLAAARQYANAAFKDAHVDVHLKAVYILALKQSGSKRDHCRVVGAQKLFHGMRLKGKPTGLSSDQTSM